MLLNSSVRDQRIFAPNRSMKIIWGTHAASVCPFRLPAETCRAVADAVSAAKPKFLFSPAGDRYNSRRMSKAEKLFEKLTAGRNDANFSFNDLCTLLTRLGYSARKTKGSHIIFQRGSSFLNLQPSTGGKEGVSSAPSAGRVAKIESQTIMKNTHAT